jgi:hypothetical protein
MSPCLRRWEFLGFLELSEDSRAGAVYSGRALIFSTLPPPLFDWARNCQAAWRCPHLARNRHAQHLAGDRECQAGNDLDGLLLDALSLAHELESNSTERALRIILWVLGLLAGWLGSIGHPSAPMSR